LRAHKVEVLLHPGPDERAGELLHLNGDYPLAWEDLRQGARVLRIVCALERDGTSCVQQMYFEASGGRSVSRTRPRARIRRRWPVRRSRFLAFFQCAVRGGQCAPAPTFNHDVAPVLFDRQPCHRPGQPVPFTR
jgi:hypothetical protein